MMNGGGGIKTALLNSKTDCFGFKTAFFHSTPVLDRKRRNYWDSARWTCAEWAASVELDQSGMFEVRLRVIIGKEPFWVFPNGIPDSLTGFLGLESFGPNVIFVLPEIQGRRVIDKETRCNHYTKSFRRINAKQTLLRNVSAYADFLFQSWQDEGDDPSSSRGTSWFKRQYSFRGSKSDRTNQRPRCWNRNFEFTEDDPEVETIFRSAFGGNRFYYWSFINEENPQWRSSSSTNYSSNYGRSWNWQYRVNEDYDDSSNEYEDSEANLVTHRLALGLKASGPLKLEDVKNAYRACALKWHPDRHQGSSKAVAEEKFKLCSVAYESLCDKLAVN